MAERKNTHGLRLTNLRGISVVDIGDMEIWDGADLSLVRDTLSVLIGRRRRRSVGINMRHVKYVPGGFFGMLYDWYESGIRIYLVKPQERVENMLWFRRFFVEIRSGIWRLEDLYETGIDGEVQVEAHDEHDGQPDPQPAWFYASTDSVPPQVMVGSHR